MNEVEPRAPTAWQEGRLDARHGAAEILFGRMLEDPAIELETLHGRERVFCIASAGCTAMKLAAAGHHITAVDVNPAQAEYAQERISGAGVREGRVDALLAKLRRLMPLVGWRKEPVREFLSLSEPKQQLDFWRKELRTWRFERALRMLLAPVTLARVYAPELLRSFPRDFAGAMIRRFERCWTTHANDNNEFAWRLLLAVETAPESRVAADRIQIVCADAAEYLEHCPAGSFDAFTLSNIVDGATVAYSERLFRAVQRAAAPRALVVLRSFREPLSEDEARWAARDRAMLWGAITVGSAETLRSRFRD